MSTNESSQRGVGWLVLASLVSWPLAMTAAEAQPVVNTLGKTSFATLPADDAASDPIDYVNAVPVEPPVADGSIAEQAIDDMIGGMRFGAPSLGSPGFSRGSQGDGGKATPKFLGRPTYRYEDPAANLPQPAAFGTNNIPFTAARADGATSVTNQTYPWRAAGRLFMNIGGSSGTCSASLIKRGIVVTAAHCVSKFGTGQVATSVSYVPGYRNGVGPYGTGAVARIDVLP
jgi:V8-like Glu-specific endopeptidase